MKFNIVFIIVFFSLLLNICHDLVVDKQLEPTKICLDTDVKSSLKHHVLDLHEIFHFSALMIKHKTIEQFSKFLRNTRFIEKIFPQDILERSFKPPRI
jgi:NhaP-type Na+/H+ and K+/H+ antiporter